jgi:signal transduction histidine kinase/PAS domain-containing protein
MTPTTNGHPGRRRQSPPAHDRPPRSSARAFVLAASFGALALLAACSRTPVAPEAPPPNERRALVLDDNVERVSAGRYVDLLEDPSGTLTFEQVASGEMDARFRPSKVDIPNIGSSSSAFWVRLRIDNLATRQDLWVIQVAYAQLNFLDLYLPAAGGSGYVVRHTGALLPPSTREFTYPGFVYSVPIPGGTRTMIYLRAASESSITFPITLWDERAFDRAAEEESLLSGAFYGAILIMFAYNLLLFFALRERTYLFLALFMGTSFVAFAGYEGWTAVLLPPIGPITPQFGLMGPIEGMGLTMLVFTDAFLLLKERAPTLHRIAIGLALAACVALAVAAFGSWTLVRLTGTPILLITFSFSLVAGSVSWHKGFEPARLYVLAWSGFAASIAIILLTRFGLFPDLPITERLYRPALLVLMVLWSLALANRVNLFKSQALEASERLRESEARLAQFLEGVPLGVVVYDAAGRMIYRNLRARAISDLPTGGPEPGYRLGRTPVQVAEEEQFRVAGSDEPYPADRLPGTRALAGEQVSADDIEAKRGDRRVPLEVWATPVFDGDGTVLYAIVAFQDITERRRVEGELRRFRLQLEDQVVARTTALSEANDALVLEISRRERLQRELDQRLEWLALYTEISQSIVRSHDLAPALAMAATEAPRFARERPALVFSLDQGAGRLVLLASSIPAGRSGDSASLRLPEDAMWRKDFLEAGHAVLSGSDREDSPLFSWLDGLGYRAMCLTPMWNQSRLVGALAFGMVEPTDLREPGMIANHQAMAGDLARLMEKADLLEKAEAVLAEQARNDLARDLHDSVTQVLFSASLVADILPTIWARDPEEGMRGLKEIRRLNRAALAEMRTLLLELRPASISATPLSELVSQLVEAATSRSELDFQLYVEQAPPVSDAVHLAFFRIAQEAMNNVIKHSEASRMILTLRAEPPWDPGVHDVWQGRMTLILEDNGRGIESTGTRKKGRGLSIMAERAESIGADLAITSAKAMGTRVTLRWNTGGTIDGSE